MSSKKTVLLCILDGWGHRTEKEYNPILSQATPTWDKLMSHCPQSFLQASGEAVGLPAGQFGNSEVGHLNLGAGRIIRQTLPKINDAFANDFLENHAGLNKALSQLDKNATIHILGLLSDGGVHSHQNHLATIANCIDNQGLNCVIHAFTDGRDCAPQSAKNCIKKFKEICNIPIATISGRYLAMDRDTNWARSLKSYNAIVKGKSPQNFATEEDAIDFNYRQKIYDEFIPPARIGNYQGMKEGDMFIMANFRADRVRQILALLTDDRQITTNLAGFAKPPKFSAMFGLSSYSKQLAEKLTILFPSEIIKTPLGEFVAHHQKTQLRLAETEKFAHVTYFFNGGRELPYENEDRILIPSPKVKTYDLKPEMSAPLITEKLCEAIRSQKYDLIITNYANPDMIGHTGNMEAALETVKVTDACLKKLTEAIDEVGSEMLLTADHGNIEIMFDKITNNPHTTHTHNRVKLIYYGTRKISLDDGILADVAPSLLKLMGLPRCPEMSGKCLINF